MFFCEKNFVREVVCHQVIMLRCHYAFGVIYGHWVTTLRCH